MAGTLVLLLLAVLASPATADGRVLVYPRAESGDDRRQPYPVAVLTLALDRAGAEIVIAASPSVMSQSRSLRQLEGRDGLDIVWTVAEQARDSRLRRVRFALDSGLMGWRVLLIRRGEAPRFAGVRDAESLAGFRLVQGHDWPDLQILKANGLTTVAATDYEALFTMLVHGRVDAVPRSVLEVIDELETRSTLPIELEPTLLLHYPASLSFYVAREDEALALTLERGLAAARTDGSLRALFERHYGNVLARVGLNSRHRIALHNPLLASPADATLDEPWWQHDQQ